MKGENKTMPLKPGTSTHPEQGKAPMAPQTKGHNVSVSDSAGKRPTVKK